MEINKIAIPHVSVIIAVYNAERYIADTINSVLSQTYSNIEIIVVDDASTDKTATTLSSFFTKKNIVIIKNKKNAGAAAARNIGYKHAKGQLIKFLDGDDLISPETISEQVKLAIDNHNWIISGKWGRFYNNDITTFKLNPEGCWQTMPVIDWISSSWQKAQSMTNPGIFLIPRNIIDKAGLWDENLSLLDDLEFFTRIILTADKVVFCKDATLYYRSGVLNSLSANKTLKGMESAYLSIKKSTDTLLDKRNDNSTKLACANVWQSFIYDIYPLYPNLVQKTRYHLSKLPSPTIKFSAGGLSKFLLPILGWKIIKKLQRHKTKITNGL